MAPSSQHQRVVGDGIGLDVQRARGEAQHVEHRAHHLRLAAQRIGVLHALVAQAMAVADRAALRATHAARRRRPLAGMAAQRMDARIEGRVGAAQRIDAHRAGDQRGAEHALGGEQPGQRQRGRDLRAVDQRRAPPSARASPARGRQRASHRRRAGAGQRPRPRPASPPSCARAARGPPRLRPSPWPGSAAARPARSIASISATTSHRTPEAPRPRLAAFIAMMRRTIRAGSGGPTPQACDRIRLRCNAARSPSPMRTEASLPKPVLTP